MCEATLCGQSTQQQGTDMVEQLPSYQDALTQSLEESQSAQSGTSNQQGQQAQTSTNGRPLPQRPTTSTPHSGPVRRPPPQASLQQYNAQQQRPQQTSSSNGSTYPQAQSYQPPQQQQMSYQSRPQTNGRPARPPPPATQQSGQRPQASGGYPGPQQLTPQQYSQFQQANPALYQANQRPPPSWNMQGAPQWQPPSQGDLQYTQQYVSTCTGNKKALLIGVNYFGSRNQLRGCINDAYAMRNFLGTFGFRNDPQHMLCLTDDQRNWAWRPTRQNIIQAMLWLVRGARSGDSLILHYSGHGTRVEDLDGDESDGYDEAICPEDFKTNGLIIDDEINNIVVKQLAPGVRLTCIFDCCHSGSILDLPYTYYADGRIKQNGAMKRVGRVAKETLMGGLYGGIIGASMSLVSSTPQLFQKSKTMEEKVMEKGNLYADVILLSGCKDSQTSADARIGGMSAGAMTYAFTQALYQYRTPTYGMLLEQVRRILEGKYSQRPQLSTSRLIDMNMVFKI